MAGVCVECGNDFGTNDECDTCLIFRDGVVSERARIIARLRAEASIRDAQAETVIARHPDAFCAMSGPAATLRDAERAAEQYRQFAHFANELRRMADLLESEGKS